ncbi:hypothetical protein MBAV_001429 [Candidatus Magnetobacterium bavaricum]|uniref:Uncharacterized protein n=1 Tax=Candidatus Magnetobacterium bavaricum TaxID=29290 RepID=A0A0F3GWX5_9BACT|nr:hypothetical protein MBAV_001429 [Candidatus Magnetobacterium bavaricum]
MTDVDEKYCDTTLANDTNQVVAWRALEIYRCAVGGFNPPLRKGKPFFEHPLF